MTLFIAFSIVLVVASIGIYLGYDPVWFCLLVGVCSFASYLITIAPLQLSWLVVNWILGL